MDKSVEHRGHKIELVGPKDEPTLRIDGEEIGWGRFREDGQYFLHRYAYDPDDSLLEVAKRYVEYRESAKQIRKGDDG